MLEYIFKYFFIPLFNTLFFCVNLNTFLGTKKNKKLFILFSLTLFTIMSAFSYFNTSALTICSILLLLYFVYIEKFSLIEFIFSYLNLLFILLISDALCGILFLKILSLSYDTVRNSIYIYTLSNLFVTITTFILSFLLSNFLDKFNFIPKFVYTNDFIRRIIYPTIFLFFVIFYIYRSIAIEYMIDLPTTYITGVFILLICITLVYYYISETLKISLKKDFIDKENKQLKDYTKMLETMSSDLRKFKHDYVNILYTLGDYINNGDIDGLKKYYNNDLLPESKNIVRTDKNITLLRNIKITPIKALVSSKLLAAQSEGIEINAEVLEEITSLSIKTIDICRILGIFLDNAIEAAILCNKKFIHFAMIKTDNDIIIVIINSCPEDIPPVYKLFEKNFSTKGKNRGIGLSNVKDLISSHYDNILLNTSNNNAVFKQELIIKHSKAE